MGWDCHPTRRGKLLRYDDDPRRLHDPILNAAFRQAAQEARRLGGGVDVLLEVGALHLRECAELLGQATGSDPYDLRGWSPDEVQQANWNFHFPKGRRVAYWSARKFLETCAEHRLGVKFSY